MHEKDICSGISTVGLLSGGYRLLIKGTIMRMSGHPRRRPEGILRFARRYTKHCQPAKSKLHANTTTTNRYRTCPSNVKLQLHLGRFHRKRGPLQWRRNPSLHHA
eukprot:jgi/Botrbrau1/3280/Bobra.174_1s0046.1